MTGLTAIAVLYLGGFSLLKVPYGAHVKAAISCALFGIGLWLLISIFGPARAIPVWIGGVSVTALSNIWLKARLPQLHTSSAALATAAGIIGLIVL